MACNFHFTRHKQRHKLSPELWPEVTKIEEFPSINITYPAVKDSKQHKQMKVISKQVLNSDEQEIQQFQDRQDDNIIENHQTNPRQLKQIEKRTVNIQKNSHALLSILMGSLDPAKCSPLEDHDGLHHNE